MRTLPYLLGLAFVGMTANADAHPGHSHRGQVSTTVVTYSYELAPRESVRLRSCPRGFEATDFDVVTWHGDTTNQRWTPRGHVWTARAVRVSHNRKRRTVKNLGRIGVTFDLYCVRD